MLKKSSKRNETKKLLHTCRCFLPSLAPFGQAVSEEKIFLTVANQKQELPLAAIFVGGTGRKSFFVSFRLANKYGCQEQFLFLIG
jgi:hypothetical protein